VLLVVGCCPNLLVLIPYSIFFLISGLFILTKYNITSVKTERGTHIMNRIFVEFCS